MERAKVQMTPEQKSLMKRDAAAAKRQMPRLRKLAADAPKPRLVQILVSEEMYDAFKVYCDQHGENLSDVFRAAGLSKCV